MNKKEKILITETANLMANIATQRSEERAAKCGYDIMHGLLEGNYQERYDVWVDWFKGDDETTEERNGVWVPAIPL